MSENENYLDQEQAKNLAGVGLDTILRYRDLGLLRVYTIKGEEKYSEEDVRLLFNSKIATSSPQPAVQAITEERPTDQRKDLSRKSDEDQKSPKREKPKEPDLPRLSDIVKEEEARLIFNGSNSSSSNGENTAQFLSNLKRQPVEGSGQAHISFHQEEISGKRGISSLGSHNSALDISSIELLELTRSLKDQLEIVKDERNWLRRRVEKLESQAEREQIILMSETETIRSLVLQKESSEKQKSPWAFLLSWARPAEQHTIEQSSQTRNEKNKKGDF